MKDNIIYDKSFDFAITIVNIYKELISVKNEYVLSKQLLRSGTSIGANISEAVRAQSKKDFIAKLHIAFKEAGETTYWLNLLTASNYLSESEANPILSEVNQISKLLSSIIKTTKNSL